MWIFKNMISGNEPLRYFFKSSIFIILFFFQFSIVKSQCLQITKEDYQIEIDHSGDKAISIIFNLSDLDLNNFNIQLYNYSNAEYYFDKNGQEKVNNDKKVTCNISTGMLLFRNLPPGDYAVVLRIGNCQPNIIGKGFSGFPNSAILINN